MDPLTHAVLGAAAAQAALGRTLGRRALLAGAAGGMMPDADLLLMPLSDPALPWELHRHASHAFLFVPIGGLLTAMLFLPWGWWRRRWKALLGAATLAYATHGPLDCCTSWGTMWLWPLSGARLSWDLVPIIDPVFTLILLAGVVRSLRGSRRAPALAALGFATAYLGLASWQHAAALEAQRDLAARRGHTIDRGRVMPTLGNVVIWRSLYDSGGRLHADALRVLPGRPVEARGGASLERLTPATWPDDRPDLAHLAGLLRRFDAMADGYLARTPGRPGIVGDMRYSIEAGGFSPLWGIEMGAGPREGRASWVDLARDGRGAGRRMLVDLLSW